MLDLPFLGEAGKVFDSVADCRVAFETRLVSSVRVDTNEATPLTNWHHEVYEY